MDLKNHYIHVVLRRMLPTEPRRHFLGRILEHTNTLAVAEGVGFYFDGSRNMFVKNPDIIKRIIPLISSGFIITLVEGEVDLASVKYHFSKNQLQVRDDQGFEIDLNEFGSMR